MTVTTVAEVNFEQTKVVEMFNADSLRIMQSEFGHDIAVATLPRESALSPRFASGTPVSIEWGWSTKTQWFYGYVHHPEPAYVEADADGTSLTTKLVCIGASLHLRQPSLSVWRNRTIPSVVEDVVSESLFSGVIQRDDTLWDQIVWHGESGWKFLVSLARRLGWTMNAVNTEITFQDRLTVIRHDKAVAEIFTSRQSRDPTTSGQYVYRMRINRSDLGSPDNERAKQRVFGVDPRTYQLVSASNDANVVSQQLAQTSREPFFTNVDQQSVVGSPSAAQSALVGAVADKRWNIEADVEVTGSPTLRPARLISLVGTSKLDDGYWYVTKVDHVIQDGDYRCFTTLGRDSTGDTGERPVAPGGRIIRQRLDPFDKLVDTPVPTLLVNGVWRSAWKAKQTAAGT